MSKFNQVLDIPAQLAENVSAVQNFEGGLAFELDAKTRLYTRVATSLVRTDKFYQSGDEHDREIVRDIQAVAGLDPEFVLRLAAYARQVLNLRSVPVLLLVEAAHIVACKPFVRRWTPMIVRRADELTEVLGYHQSRFGDIGSRGLAGGNNALPNSLKRGLFDAFGRFDEYQLAKYDRPGAFTLKDVVRLVGFPGSRPVRDWLLNGSINAFYLPKAYAKAQLVLRTEFDSEARRLAAEANATWEVLISQFGNKWDVWDAVVPNMGYMALLRNLRNLIQAGANMDPVLRRLGDEQQVRYSKQLPFRFLSARREVEQVQNPQSGRVISVLDRALEASVANLPRLPGKTFIVVDNSGSMGQPLNARQVEDGYRRRKQVRPSAVTYADVANLLGSLTHTLCEQSVTGSFGTDFAPVVVSQSDSIMTNMRLFAEADTRGMQTNAYRVMQYLRGQWRQDNGDEWWGYRTAVRQQFTPQLEPVHVDRIIILSDMQCYDTHGDNSMAAELRRYRASVNPNVYVYSVDLAGLGTTQIPPGESRTALVAGWSERLLEYIALFESDGIQAVDRISQWQPQA